MSDDVLDTAQGDGPKMSWARALVSWFALAFLMIVNGAAREALVEGVVDPLVAHQISSVFGIVIILVASSLLVPWIGAVTPSAQIALGLVWLLCTVAFEFAFGHWVAGHSLEVLLADYDLASGRLWPLVLIATASAPWLVGRWHARPPT